MTPYYPLNPTKNFIVYITHYNHYLYEKSDIYRRYYLFMIDRFRYD